MDRKENKQEKEAIIIRAATVLFSKQGYEKTTIRQILSEAGVSTGSFYHHFKYKDAVILAVFENILKEIRTMTGPAIHEFQEPLLSLSMGAALQVSAMLDNQQLFNLYNLSWAIESVEMAFVRRRAEQTQIILEKARASVGRTFTHDEIYARELALNAGAGALLRAKRKGNLQISVEEIYLLLIKIWCAEFAVKPSKTEELISITRDIMSRNEKAYKEMFRNGLMRLFDSMESRT